MLYEKKPDIDIKRILIHYALPITSGIFLLTLEAILYLPKEFWDIKFIDIINALAQIATAGAFYLGFRQYKEAKEKDRQNILSSECKIIIGKIIECIGAIPTNQTFGPDSLEPIMTRLANLGEDFDELFRAMKEDVSKGIARMYWQDMHFNHLIPQLRQLAVFHFLMNCGVPNNDFQIASNEAHTKHPTNGTDVQAQLASQAVMIINNEIIKNKFRVIEWQWLDSFKSTFYDDHKNSDYFWMLRNKTDMEYQAPIFFALYQLRYKALHPEKRKDPKHLEPVQNEIA